MISGYLITSVCAYVSYKHPTDNKITTFIMQVSFEFLDSNYDRYKGKLFRLQAISSTSEELEWEKDTFRGHARIHRIGWMAWSCLERSLGKNESNAVRSIFIFTQQVEVYLLAANGLERQVKTKL